VLVLGIVTPVAGYLADRFGLKRMFILGLGLFTAGSAACGVAPTLAWLIAGRVLQGIGGGITQPSGTALLYRAFPPSRIGRAFGVFGLALLVAPALGPVLGGGGGRRLLALDLLPQHSGGHLGDSRGPPVAARVEAA
jgi:DHA2 family multidrug resistance protein